MIEERYWRAVTQRDSEFDGLFVVAVKTTGIYCRPSCPAKTPKRENVEFHSSPAEAAAAGYRACKRCRPDEVCSLSAGARIVRDVCRMIEEDPEQIPTLADLESGLGVSRYHLQRVFKQMLGVTPRQYADARRLEILRRELREGDNVADAVYGAGFGSSSRVYERSDEHLGMTPAQYRRGGISKHIRYAVVDSSLGKLLVAATDKGVCRIRLGERESDSIEALHEEFGSAQISKDEDGVGPIASEVVSRIDGRRPSKELPFDVRATAFQRMVWEELQRIPHGETRSYSEVAAAIGRPRAVRAVANACAGNPVAIVVPCHRVVRKNGELGGYGWGTKRKAELLQRESSTDSQK